MKSIQCPSCKKFTPSNRSECLACGHPLPTSSNKNKISTPADLLTSVNATKNSNGFLGYDSSQWIIALVIFLAGISYIFYAMFSNSNSNNTAHSQEHAIDKSRVYKSEPETVFCTSKASAKDFQGYMEKKDVAAAGSIIQSGGCSIVTPSLELFIDSEDTGVVEVRRKGLTSVVWTFKHMLK